MTTIRFSDFELDPDCYVLERAGRPVPLRPKAFDLLVHLARHRRRVVRREELVAVVWGPTRVGSGSLSGLVNEVRQALDEEAGEQSSIRTVHARGYQFVARVEGDDEAGRGHGEEEPRPERGVEALLERVAERGAAGAFVPGRAGVADPLASVVEAAEARGFESLVIVAPEEGSASGGWLAARLVESMRRLRGTPAVAEALPLPARRWIRERRPVAVAGGQALASDGPPGGVDAVATMLAHLARRRPIALVCQDVAIAGAGFASDLARLVARMGSAPLFAAVHAQTGLDRAPWSRILEVDGGFVPVGGDGSGRREPNATHAQPRALPAPLEKALLEHLSGDRRRLERVVAALAERGAGTTDVRRVVSRRLGEGPSQRRA